MVASLASEVDTPLHSRSSEWNLGVRSMKKSGVIMAIFDGGGKFLYQTTLGIKDAEDSDGLAADMGTVTVSGKLTELKWRDAEGHINHHRHGQGAFGYAILRDGVRIGKSGTAPK
jgi:hypothetical protein